MIEGLFMFFMMIVGIIVGIPIPISVFLAALYGIWVMDLPLVFIAQSAYDALEGIPLMTIPLFVFAGAVMQRGGMAIRLVNFARTLVGQYPASTGIVSVLGCTFFAALSGSTTATTAAVGSITVPEMEKDNYDLDFSGALVAAGGGLGSLIPPSNLLIIYGIISDRSIPQLFLAGVFPGLVASLALIFVTWLMAYKRGYGGSNLSFNFKRSVTSAYESKWSLLAPVIILGGIYAGIFTATEAAAVATVYALIIAGLVYRELSWRDLRICFQNTIVIVGSVVFILGPAKAFGQLLSLMEVPDLIGSLIYGVTNSPFIFLMLVALIYIVTGTVIESIPQIILFTPLLLPIAIDLGISPLLLGITTVICCEIGFLTPPVGVNLFVASKITGLSLEKISIAAIPFLLTYTIVTILIASFPPITTYLPMLFYSSLP